MEALHVNIHEAKTQIDRLLIAQAMVEDMQLLSRDSRLSAYNIKRIW